MNRDDNRLDELIRNRLEHYSPEPSPEIWERVQSGMVHKKRRQQPLWYRWAAAAAILLAVMVTGLLLHDGKPEQAPRVAIETTPAAPEAAEPDKGGPTLAEAHPDNSGAAAAEAKPSGTVKSSSNTRKNSGFGNMGSPASTSSSGFPAKIESSEILAGVRESTPVRFSLSGIKSIAGVLEQNREITRPGLATGKKSTYRELTAEEMNRLTAMARPAENQLPSGGKAWKVGMHLSPAYSSYSASHSSDYARNMTRSGSQSEGGIGGGISVQYKASDHWRIESGMYYARSGDKSENSGSLFAARGDYYAMSSGAGSYFNTPISLDNGQIAMNSTAGVITFNKTPGNAQLITLPETAYGLRTAMLSPGKFYQVFDFMEIPVTARYRVLEQGVELDLVSGISTNLVIGNNVFMESGGERENVGFTRDISTVNFSGIVGVGMIYPLWKNVALSLEPRASYYFNSLSQSSEVDFRPWKVGLYTGLTYEF